MTHQPPDPPVLGAAVDAHSGVDENFTVFKGDPTDEELGALLVVLAARLQARPVTAPAPTGTGWSAYWRSVRAPLAPGAGAWRASARG